MTMHLRPDQRPRRLHALLARVADDTQYTFGDWQFSRASELTKFYPENERELVGQAAAGLLPFAGSFTGGVLVLDLRAAEPENAPVVEFDDEGGITVLGESFDDFLALLASDEPDEMEDIWTATSDLRSWILASGVRPHQSAHTRLTMLAERTREFSSDWAKALRQVSIRERPNEIVDYPLVFGERIGEVILGMERTKLDSRLGLPELPVSGRGEGRITAMYPGVPYVVDLDADARYVVGVTLFAGRHRVVAHDGTDPAFMRATEACDWLSGLGWSPVRLRSEIRVPAAKLRLSIEHCRGGKDAEPWVSAVTISEAIVG
jgi:hypothetical protein